MLFIYNRMCFKLPPLLYYFMCSRKLLICSNLANTNINFFAKLMKKFVCLLWINRLKTVFFRPKSLSSLYIDPLLSFWPRKEEKKRKTEKDHQSIFNGTHLNLQLAFNISVAHLTWIACKYYRIHSMSDKSSLLMTRNL